MGSKHKYTILDRARDELFSHVVRCDVLQAHMEDRKEWLNETMDFMAHRYPQLNELQLAQLEVLGSRFIKPVIPHGHKTNAVNRDAWQDASKIEADWKDDSDVEGDEWQSPSDAEEEEALQPA